MLSNIEGVGGSGVTLGGGGEGELEKYWGVSPPSSPYTPSRSNPDIGVLLILIVSMPMIIKVLKLPQFLVTTGHYICEVSLRLLTTSYCHRLLTKNF